MESATDMQTVTATGQIELFRIEANGIVSTEVYYATSTRSDVPPGLDSAKFEIDENITLGFEDVGASFHIHKDNTLWGWYDSNEDGQQDEDEIQQFTVTDSVLEGIKNTTIGSSGTTGWTKTIPRIDPGQYLWTKTIQTYSDGSMTVTYGLYHWGADAELFKIDCGFNEILRFVSTDEDSGKEVVKVSVNPKKLPVRVQKQFGNSVENVSPLNNDKLQVFIYDLEFNANYKITGYTDPTLTENTIEIGINDLLEDAEEGKIVGNDNIKAAEILREKNCYLKLIYQHEEKNEANEITKSYELTEYIGIRYASNFDMATLSLKADGLVAAMRDTKMVFNEQGLTIENGSFKIVDGDKEVLRMDDDGNLALTGTIYAKNGEIGGFIIGKDSLKAVQQVENKSITTIELNGAQGCIFIGESNDNNDNQIVIDGPAGEIYSKTGKEGITRNWSISGNEAIFNNIVARGSIEAAVFEYGEVQAIGGILIARPSSKITEIGQIEESGKIYYLVTVENSAGFLKEDICIIGNHNSSTTDVYDDIGSRLFKIRETTDDNKLKLEDLLGTTLSEKDISLPIISIGHKGSIGIGINGSNNNSFVEANAITVFEANDIDLDEYNSKNLINTHIVLGQLGSEKSIYGQAAGSYGLYADNVVLHGALTTKFEAGDVIAYAGVNTNLIGTDIPQSDPTKFRNNSSAILIWAGAKSDDKAGVENSNFYVDRNGNIYAKSGYFEGSVIANATVEASNIKAARITGMGSGDSPGLIIEDVNQGIVFYDQGTTKFSLARDGIKSKLSLYAPDIYINSKLKINEDGIAFDSSGSENNFNEKSKIVLEDSAFSFRLGGHEELLINDEYTLVQNSLSVTGSVWYGETMEYRQVQNDDKKIIGYDLYVRGA